VYLADDQWEALVELAAKEDRSVNSVVRRAVGAYLDGSLQDQIIVGVEQALGQKASLLGFRATVGEAGPEEIRPIRPVPKPRKRR
jgi:hypothetical protein